MNFIYACVVLIAAFWAISNFTGFAGQSSSDYADGPVMDIRQVLNGRIACDGVIYGPFGKVAARFVGDFYAEWDGNSGTMTEEFTYDNGTKQTRKWTLRVSDDGTIVADAPDLFGQGTGKQQGSALNLRYNIRLTEAAGGHVLSVTDWLYLLPNGHIVNRSEFRKFGIKVGELVATMRPA